jgi:hypothetical protein
MTIQDDVSAERDKEIMRRPWDKNILCELGALARETHESTGMIFRKDVKNAPGQTERYNVL